MTIGMKSRTHYTGAGILKTEVSPWKCVKCFPLTLRQRNLKMRQSLYQPFWISVWRKLVLGNHVILMTSSFSRNSVFKMISVHIKTKAAVFNFLRFEKRFRKAPFLGRISVDGTPNLARVLTDGVSSWLCLIEVHSDSARTKKHNEYTCLCSFLLTCSNSITHNTTRHCRVRFSKH